VWQWQGKTGNTTESQAPYTATGHPSIADLAAKYKIDFAR